MIKIIGRFLNGFKICHFCGYGRFDCICAIGTRVANDNEKVTDRFNQDQQRGH